jgi:trans-aconitate methyltransferase
MTNAQQITESKKAEWYSPTYYEAVAKNSGQGDIAQLIIEQINPKSVVEVGCASGVLLKELTYRNSKVEILGIDGNWINDKQLQIPIISFMHHDITKPINMNRRFDLCVCLEVAEHIDEKYADILINSLTELSDTVLFSAAIPYQEHKKRYHLNEQWQSYWAEKFKVHGYIPNSKMRELLWNKKEVESWYRQNVLLYRKNIASEAITTDVVCPESYLRYADPKTLPLRTLFKAARYAPKRIFKYLITGKSN